jgi:hypothetical protein
LRQHGAITISGAIWRNLWRNGAGAIGAIAPLTLRSCTRPRSNGRSAQFEFRFARLFVIFIPLRT